MINTWGKSLRLYSGVGLSCKDVTHRRLQSPLSTRWNKGILGVHMLASPNVLPADGSISRYTDEGDAESCYDQKYHKQLRTEVISMDMRLIPLESFT